MRNSSLVTILSDLNFDQNKEVNKEFNHDSK